MKDFVFGIASLAGAKPFAFAFLWLGWGFADYLAFLFIASSTGLWTFFADSVVVVEFRFNSGWNNNYFGFYLLRRVALISRF